MTDDTWPLVVNGEAEEVHSAVELKSRPVNSPFYPQRGDSSDLLQNERRSITVISRLLNL